MGCSVFKCFFLYDVNRIFNSWERDAEIQWKSLVTLAVTQQLDFWVINECHVWEYSLKFKQSDSFFSVLFFPFLFFYWITKSNESGWFVSIRFVWVESILPLYTWVFGFDFFVVVVVDFAGWQRVYNIFFFSQYKYMHRTINVHVHSYVIGVWYKCQLKTLCITLLNVCSPMFQRIYGERWKRKWKKRVRWQCRGAAV